MKVHLFLYNHVVTLVLAEGTCWNI